MKFITSLFLSVVIAQGAYTQTLCENGMAADWPCENINLWTFMSLDDLGGGEKTNDIWGWVDAESGREFALVGMDAKMVIVEITDPASPIIRGSVTTQTDPSTWRDIKTYNDFAFIVSEAADHGMQIVDLSQILEFSGGQQLLPDVVYDGFGDAHNIVINEDSGYAYGVGTDTFSGGLHIVDISDPLNPVLAGGFEEDGYTHDAQVVMYAGPDVDYAGTEIAFGFNTDNVAIINVTDKTDCQLISHAIYENVGYTHQGWVTEDHKYLLMGDEVDELNFGNNTRTHIFDIQDLDNPIYTGFYDSDNTAIDHNMYILENFVYQSNYRSGVRVLDAVNIEAPELYEIGYFDLFPSDDDAGFSGSWSNYPYFPSGNVVATSINEGMFILQPNFFEVSPAMAIINCGVDETTYNVNVNAALIGTFDVSVMGLGGSVSATADSFTAPGSVEITLSGLSGLAAGSYDFSFVLTSEYGEYNVKGSLTSESQPPLPPVLTSPADMEAVGNNMVTFFWEAAADATGYLFEIALDDQFEMLVFTDLPLTNSFEMPAMLLDDTYFWRVKGLNSCGEGDFSEVWQFTVSTVGVEEMTPSIFHLFPNPTNGRVVLNSNHVLGQINIVDVSGKIVENINSSSESIILDLSHLSSGLYLVHVLGASPQRLIIQ